MLLYYIIYVLNYCFFIIILFLILWHLTSTHFPYTTLFRSPLAKRSVAMLRKPEKREGAIVDVGVRAPDPEAYPRSEEHTSELQSQSNLVCRLLLEKKKVISIISYLSSIISSILISYFFLYG